MSRLTDKELIQELQYRFSQNKKSLGELSALTKQLQKVNNKLKESERLKSQFLSNIRNEMNNPLASILGLSKNIQAIDSKQWQRIKSMAAFIHTEAFSLDFQLKNIFAAAELESGELVLEIVQTNIAAIFSNVLDMFSHQLKAKQIIVHIQQNAEEIQNRLFRTDPAKFQLIISNLVANAIEYSHPQGEIIIKMWIQKEMLYISVQDFGIGINKVEQNMIFNRFTQLDSSVTKLHRGHGLGLSVTKSLIELMNGKIEVSSITSKGSTFTVSIQESVSDVYEYASNSSEVLFTGGELF